MKTPSGKLKAKLVQIQSLTESEKMRMLLLMRGYYNGMTEEAFASDLSKKTGVFLLRDTGSQEIQGFSTVLVQQLTLGDRSCQGVFSGDTIVAKEYWGQRALQRSFALYMFMLKLKRPTEPLFWFLMSKGYKTYLLLANNFFIHYPRFDRPIPASIKRVMDLFYSGLFSEKYDASTGLITFSGETCRLRSGVAEITDELVRANPRIAYFQKANPQWTEGTELACVAKLTWLNPLAYLMKTWVKNPARRVWIAVMELGRSIGLLESRNKAGKETL